MALIPTPGVGPGSTTGIAKLAASVGKPGRSATVGRGQPPQTITGGNPMAHAMNHYGKGGPSILAGGSGMPGSTGVDPTSHPGATMIRGSKGGMRKNAREGGLGPGPQATAGGDTNYNATSQDVE